VIKLLEKRSSLWRPFFFFDVYITLMLCNCPYCATVFPTPCINGFVFCSKCQRVIESDKRNQYISAYRLIKMNKYSNYDQLKCHLRLSEEDLKYLLECYEAKNLTVEEFEKTLG